MPLKSVKSIGYNNDHKIVRFWSIAFGIVNVKYFLSYYLLGPAERLTLVKGRVSCLCSKYFTGYLPQCFSPIGFWTVCCRMGKRGYFLDREGPQVP